MDKNHLNANGANNRILFEYDVTRILKTFASFAHSRNSRFVFFTILFLLSACGQATVPAPTAPATETVLPTSIPTETSTPSPVPTPTLTPEPEWYQPIDASYGVMKYRYGLVENPYARVYVTLNDAAAQSGNFGYLPNTPAGVAIDGEETRDGKTYYAMMLGWMSAEDVKMFTPSTFRGILLTRQVDFRFGWVKAETQSVNAAGTPVRMYARYEIVHEVPAVTGNPGYFAVGSDEWLPLSALAVTSSQVPADAGTCRFLHVDLTQQILRVFDACQLVFATLVSTGRERNWTYPGRYTIVYRQASTLLTPPAGFPGEYYLWSVPFFMGFNGDIGFHGTYWHDDFGTPVSHGCVNLSPADAKWLYEWAIDGENVIVERTATP
jgi:lipoprotein-anchoring transpeptidase ErfK/SrfK